MGGCGFCGEDTIEVTETGADVLLKFFPSEIEGIEKLMKEKRILDMVH